MPDLAAPEPDPEPARDPAAKPPRKQSRAARREQLIDATIAVIAEKGYARTTLADVARRAGLSQGLANFHFASKERLLAETMVQLAEDYRQNWMRVLAEAGPAPARQLDALIRADLSPELNSPLQLAAWCAFWGEAQARPVYQELCGSNDETYIALIEDICTRLIAEGGYDLPAIRVARALRVAVAGVWLDLVTMRVPYGLDEALATLHLAASAFFPRHFDAQGVIDPAPQG